MTFLELLRKVRGNDHKAPAKLLCLDPGETTGWAVFERGELTDWGQSATLKQGWSAIHDLFEEVKPTHVVFENYRVYQHKLSQHANSEVYTLRLIGVIEYLCYMQELENHTQMASTAKGFCKDSKLKEWGYWQPGMKHARDAIRHGCYYQLFHGRTKEAKK